MKTTAAIVAAALALAGWTSAAQAQPAPSVGTLRVTVHDPSGAVIPNATVQIRPMAPASGSATATTVRSDGRGVAGAAGLTPGRYSIEVSFPGFETRTVTDVRIHAGENRREVTLQIEKVSQTVSADRDPALAASDPRSDRFGNVLSKDQIAALPDDPDEMEQALKDMAGPGAMIRVDGFYGGKLPPKSQIRSIRFSNSMFAAENHGAGLTFIDIATQPGVGPLRGGLDFTFRDGALDGRNAFEPVKGPEQTQQYGFNLSGRLWKDRTSFSIGGVAASLFDAANVYAALPNGDRTGAIRRPADRMNLNARLDHALTKSHLLRASFQQSDNDQHDLGVGGFDLPDRAYSKTATDRLLRLSESGPWSKSWFGESRLQLHNASTNSASLDETPTLTVLDAFTEGGAQQSGGARSTELEYATNVDYAKHGHAVRVGTLVDGGVYRSNAAANYLGTFTFASLADYNAGRPENYTIRTGDPAVAYSYWQGAVFAQDDWRMRKNLTLSGGVREELQTVIGTKWNLAPRGGFTWAPFKNGRTTIRGGGGVFYDWLDASVYEQTLRVDGTRQQDLMILDPGYPDPYSGGAGQQVLPPSRYQLAPGLVLPRRAAATAGLTEQLGQSFNLNVGYTHMDGWDRYRGLNINAPLNGVRPVPSRGNITQVESTSRMLSDQINVGLNTNLSKRRTFLFANYAWIRQWNDSDGAFSLPADSHNLSGEWARATGVPRHVVSAVINTTLPKSIRFAMSTTARSGTPYNITTGRDENLDGVFTDRPAGTPRNSAVSTASWDVAARMSYAFGFGQRSAGGGGGGQLVIVRAGGSAGDLLGGMSGLPGGSADDKRVRFEVFVAVANLLNRVNLLNYSGVKTSPFFMEPTAAGPARKIDLGMKIGF